MLDEDKIERGAWSFVKTRKLSFFFLRWILSLYASPVPVCVVCTVLVFLFCCYRLTDGERPNEKVLGRREYWDLLMHVVKDPASKPAAKKKKPNLNHS